MVFSGKQCCEENIKNPFAKTNRFFLDIDSIICYLCSNFLWVPCYPAQAESREFKFLLFVERNFYIMVPVGETHLYYAAMNSKACQLTPLGQFYWQLANERKL